MSAKIDQLIYDTAIKQGFKPSAAKLVVAQARFESADYTSNVFKANNNTSGMKFIGQPLATRGSLAPKNERSESCQAGGICKNSDHYAKFASVQDSANERFSTMQTGGQLNKAMVAYNAGVYICALNVSSNQPITNPIDSTSLATNRLVPAESRGYLIKMLGKDGFLSLIYIEKAI